ncbi:MAG: DMT family transporter, partial [Paracoccaceae bacterium]
MSPPVWSLALIMCVAGIGIPALAALNAALGVRIGSPWAAAAVLFAIAFVC